MEVALDAPVGLDYMEPLKSGQTLSHMAVDPITIVSPLSLPSLSPCPTCTELFFYTFYGTSTEGSCLLICLFINLI